MELIATPCPARTACGGTRSGGSSGLPMRGYRQKANVSFFLVGLGLSGSSAIAMGQQCSAAVCPIILGVGGRRRPLGNGYSSLVEGEPHYTGAICLRVKSHRNLEIAFD